MAHFIQVLCPTNNCLINTFWETHSVPVQNRRCIVFNMTRTKSGESVHAKALLNEGLENVRQVKYYAPNWRNGFYCTYLIKKGKKKKKRKKKRKKGKNFPNVEIYLLCISLPLFPPYIRIYDSRFNFSTIFCLSTYATHTHTHNWPLWCLRQCDSSSKTHLRRNFPLRTTS